MSNELIEKDNLRQKLKMNDEGFYWYPLHGGDFLNKTAMLSPEEIGCYMLMSVHLIRHHMIPRDAQSLKMLCKGADTLSIAKALSLFTEWPEGYSCEDIINAKLKAMSISQKRSEAGIASAKSRQDKRIANNFNSKKIQEIREKMKKKEEDRLDVKSEM